jgi:hypothetical protein
MTVKAALSSRDSVFALLGEMRALSRIGCANGNEESIACRLAGEVKQGERVSLSQVLALARVGAVDAAWSLLGTLDSEIGRAPAALTLRGRLLKDRAASQRGAARTALLREASYAYAAAAVGGLATYPLINAATLSFLGGAPARSEELARETLALLDSGHHEPDTRYWLGATRAEALLLLGQETEARRSLRHAVAETPRAWEDHAVTLRQFRLILAEQGRPDDWLDALRPPAALHFAGPMATDSGVGQLERSIEAAVAAVCPGTATGALAAGFDIVAAEILQRSGAELCLILPCGIADFVDASVRPYGETWVTRFERLAADAAGLEFLEEPVGLCAGTVVLAEEMALGLTVREARTRDAQAVLLRIEGSPGQVMPSPTVRIVEVAGQNGDISVPSMLPPVPARPIALLGCERDVVEELAQLASGPIEALKAGAFVRFTDLAEAAEVATTLQGLRQGSVIGLDYGLPHPSGLIEAPRLEALLEIAPREYSRASRPAALALEVLDGSCRTAVAGEWSGGAAPSFEFFSLWCQTDS